MVQGFLSVDPLTAGYPELTPYQFAHNSPIQAIDLDGLEGVYYSLVFDEGGKSKLEVTAQQDGTVGNFTGKHLYIHYKGNTYYQSSVPNSSAMKYLLHDVLGAPTEDDLLSQYEGRTEAELDNLFSHKETRDEMVANSREESDQQMQELFEAGALAKSPLKLRGSKKPKNKTPKISKPKISTPKVASNNHSFNGHTFDKGSSPMKIPKSATVTEQIKTGYSQVKFKWQRGKFKYEARWHTRTPGAPASQGDTWVITRTTPGSSTGLRKQQHILTGKYKWTKMNVWQNAVRANQSGTATNSQQQMLNDGHHKSY